MLAEIEAARAVEDEPRFRTQYPAPESEADWVEAFRRQRSISPEEIAWAGFVPAPNKFLSLELREFFDLVEEDLLRPATRLVRLLRWIFNLVEVPRPLTDARFEWSLEGEVWYQAPRRWESPDSPVYGGEGNAVLSVAGIELLQRLVAEETFDEPIARQILHEAVALRESNRRAGSVLAVAAAEIACKAFVASSDPELENLLFERNAPSLLQLIHRLPELSEQRTKDGRVVPKRLTATLWEAVNRRNGIVHGASDAPSTLTELEEVLAATNDFLYLLDWLAGNDWAFRNIRDEIRAEWEGSEPT